MSATIFNVTKGKKMEKSNIGTRMKRYEHVGRVELMARTPVMIRLDGKAFHTYTKDFIRPFDEDLFRAMTDTMEYLVANIQGCVLGYVQSDEISLLLRDWDTFETDTWYGNNKTKIESVSASMCSVMFNRFIQKELPAAPPAFFDSRAWNLPKEEVCNYFIWRQQDATRNSINMLAQSLYSAKQLHGKNMAEVHDMLMLGKGVNWNDLDTWKKRGACAYKSPDGQLLDMEIPIFTQDRDFINRHLLSV